MPGGVSTANGTTAPTRVHWRHYDPLELPPTLAGALEGFSEHGYHGTPVRDIAARTGLTVPALYYHHGSKEGMLVALLTGSLAELNDRVEQAVREAGPDPVDRLANFVSCLALWGAHRGMLAALDAEIRSLSPKNRRAYAKARKQIEDLLLLIVRAGATDGVFRLDHIEDTVRAVLGMLQAVAIWYDPAGELTPDDLADRYVEICLRTVGHTGAESRGTGR